jgi:hypothetical protein
MSAFLGERRGLGKPEAPKPRRIQVGSGEKATIEGKSRQA